MALNIKNPRVIELAREAAETSGVGLTSIIETALEEYLQRHRAARDDRFTQLQGQLELFWAQLPTNGPPRIELEAELYDQDGLPR